MRIAIPMADGRLAQHFGHCEKFALVDVDPVTKEITASTEVETRRQSTSLGFCRRHGLARALAVSGGLD